MPVTVAPRALALLFPVTTPPVVDRPLTLSSLGGWLVVALLAPGLLLLVATVVAFLVRSTRPRPRGDDGPGYYHVLGFDRETQAHRELTFHADGPRGARGRAELDGMVVTEVRQVDESE